MTSLAGLSVAVLLRDRPDLRLSRPEVITLDHLIRTDGRVRMPVPPGREQIAGAALVKAATAIHLVAGQLFFAIARNNGNSSLLDQSNRRRRIPAIGHHIARANHMRRINSAMGGLDHQGLCCLQIGIWPAKQQDIPIYDTKILDLHRCQLPLEPKAARAHNTGQIKG